MDIKLVEERKSKLAEVSKILKSKFVGIDNVIDRIIDNISLWYIMPELQLRPPIMALWGITGIGKTDLIRTLVKHLDFNDKFIEIQMDDIDRHYNNTYNEQTEINAHLVTAVYKLRNKKFNSFELFYKKISKNTMFKYLTDDNKKLAYKYLDEYYHETKKEN